MMRLLPIALMVSLTLGSPEVALGYAAAATAEHSSPDNAHQDPKTKARRPLHLTRQLFRGLTFGSLALGIAAVGLAAFDGGLTLTGVTAAAMHSIPVSAGIAGAAYGITFPPKKAPKTPTKTQSNEQSPTKGAKTPSQSQAAFQALGEQPNLVGDKELSDAFGRLGKQLDELEHTATEQGATATLAQVRQGRQNLSEQLQRVLDPFAPIHDAAEKIQQANLQDKHSDLAQRLSGTVAETNQKISALAQQLDQVSRQLASPPQESDALNSTMASVSDWLTNVADEASKVANAMDEAREQLEQAAAGIDT